MPSEIIDALWFSNPRGCYGVALVKDTITGERKAYIGPCGGNNEKLDALYIKENGAKVTLQAVERIYNHLRDNDGKKK
jgi:hypothetical protein